MRIKNLLLFIMAGLSLLLSGCWFIYKPDIKQGNILNTKKVSEIHPGMTEKEVVELLGKPVLVNLFADHQMIYVYTILPGHGEFQAQQLRIYFANGQVTRYTSSVH
jgi:outer membrane protein assembly factor BamE